ESSRPHHYLASRPIGKVTKKNPSAMAGFFVCGPSPYIPYNGLNTAMDRLVCVITRLRHKQLIYCAVPR
ncbi:hypothetical protein, partial [Thalassospira sp. UBA4513]|uniref:hypothetical protein n=1 Tax=Thalassospira sp. UBA4513 TaxID=1947675 RepID=UPI002580CE8C